MSSPVAFTFDLEDHRPDSSAEIRYRAVTEMLLDCLDEWQVRGTVFVVGELIDESPDLIGAVAGRGHEIGLHGAHHVPLPELGPDRFRESTKRATDALSDLLGRAVAGYRAPIFSLVPESAWAPEILSELGYGYSSSVLPARNPLYGWADAPRRPFRWPCGLVELPSPVFGFGALRLPLLGGTYLRTAPGLVTAWARHRVKRHPAPWLYAHPYDFDVDEPRWIVDEVGRLGSWLLWYGRRRMARRVRRTVAGADVTLAELAVRHRDAPIFGLSGASNRTSPSRASSHGASSHGTSPNGASRSVR